MTTLAHLPKDDIERDSTLITELTNLIEFLRKTVPLMLRVVLLIFFRLRILQKNLVRMKLNRHIIAAEPANRLVFCQQSQQFV